MKYDLSKLTEEDIDTLSSLCVFHTNSIYEEDYPDDIIDPDRAIKYKNRTRKLCQHIEHLLNKLSQPIIEKTDITAQEAREMMNKKFDAPLNPALINALMVSIRGAIEQGRTKILTSFLSEDGIKSTVPSRSNQLSQPTILKIVEYFTNLGYYVSRHEQNPDICVISWAEESKKETK